MLALPISEITGPGIITTSMMAAEAVKPSSASVPMVAPAPMAKAPDLGTSHLLTSVAV